MKITSKHQGVTGTLSNASGNEKVRTTIRYVGIEGTHADVTFHIGGKELRIGSFDIRGSQFEPDAPPLVDGLYYADRYAGGPDEDLENGGRLYKVIAGTWYEVEVNKAYLKPLPTATGYPTHPVTRLCATDHIVPTKGF